MIGSLIPNDPSFERRLVWLIVLLATLSAGVFSGKAFHLDDPVFLLEAQQTARAPLHPHDFLINWGGRMESGRNAIVNPPAFGYVLAPLTLGGIREWKIHLALAPLFGLYVLGTARLARSFGVSPALSALFVAVSPVVLVCATNVMPDMCAGAALVWGVALWIEGLHKNSLTMTLGGGMLLAFATLNRYHAISGVGALAVYAIVARRHAWRSWIALAIAPLAAALWLGAMGGKPVPTSLQSFDSSANMQALRALSMGVALAMTAAPTIWILIQHRYAAILSIASGVFLLLVGLTTLGQEAQSDPYSLSALLLAGAACGPLLHLLYQPFRGDLPRDVRARDALIVSWVLFDVLFPVLHIHASAKYIVQALPALAVAAAGASLLSHTKARLLKVYLATYGCIAIAVAVADYKLAAVHRSMNVKTIKPLIESGRTVWSISHWGFQWYAMQAGARQVDDHSTAESGDMLVASETAAGTDFFPYVPNGTWKVATVHTFHDRFPVRTMNLDAGAGFYSDFWGIFPFTFSTEPIDRLFVWTIQPRTP